MRISGNFSTPSFKKLYIDDDIKPSLERLKKDESTGEIYKTNINIIKELCGTRDVLIKSYGQKGVQVQEIDSKTGAVKRRIAHSKNNILEGIVNAATRILRDERTGWSLTIKYAFPYDSSVRRASLRKQEAGHSIYG